MIIDSEQTYIILEDADKNTFKMPINVLGDIILLNNEENSMMVSLIDAIDELSLYILELSESFNDEHFSMEELSTVYELKSDVDYLLIDKNILTENDVEKIINDSDLITIGDVEDKYMLRELSIDNIFDKIEDEFDSYEFEDEVLSAE